MSKATLRKKYQEHLDQGLCTASPEHGCSECYLAQEAGLIPDPIDDPEYELEESKALFNGDFGHTSIQSDWDNSRGNYE